MSEDNKNRRTKGSPFALTRLAGDAQIQKLFAVLRVETLRPGLSKSGFGYAVTGFLFEDLLEFLIVCERNPVQRVWES